MTLPFALGELPLPDWLPNWVPVVLLIPLVLYGLLVLAMPFAVFGLRGRLDAIEAQLDDLHAEVRALALHLGPPPDERPRAVRGSRATRTREEPKLGWSRGADD